MGCCVLIIGIATLIFLVGHRRKVETVDTTIAALPEKVLSKPADTSMEKIKTELSQFVTIQKRSADSLTNANQCVHYILGLADKLPKKNGTARSQLRGLAVALFISDYVMAAHKDQSLKLSAADMSLAFTNAASEVFSNDIPEDMLKLFSLDLQSYNGFQEMLPEHYERIKQNPSASNGIQQVMGTLSDFVTTFDPQSDMLLDCLRMLCMKTTAEQFYGQAYAISMEDLRDLAGSSSAATAEKVFGKSRDSETTACSLSFAQVLQWRLSHRYGIDEKTAATITWKLWSLPVNQFSKFSSADLQVPAAFQ